MNSSPQVKFEASPVESLADSFPSTPGASYPSLFEPIDLNDMGEAMTPQSYDDDSMFGSMAGTPAPEKKPVKKRKSWGQQLPEPKTNLPPRKRAKTEDEKEQRRVERVLRNRRAAQSSRERKRQEVEALEAKMNEKERINEDMKRRNADLQMQLENAQANVLALQQQLELAAGGNMAVFRGTAPSSPAPEHFRRAPSPVPSLTFSQELFSSRDAPERASNPSFTSQPIETTQTVNPASLSPELRPVDESNASSSDMTQHPAAMLWNPDLQCHYPEEQRPWTATSESTLAFKSLLSLLAYLSLLSALGSTLLTPLGQIFSSLTKSTSLLPSPSIITSIIWLTTTTAPLTASTSTTSSSMNTTNPHLKLTLRIRMLNQLLTCSPNLARPLKDATLGAMRLASEQQLGHVDCSNGVGSSDRRDDSPSIEALMTLLWAIHVFEERRLTVKLDIATDVFGQQDSRGELDVSRQKFMARARRLSFQGFGESKGQKSLEDWRMADR